MITKPLLSNVKQYKQQAIFVEDQANLKSHLYVGPAQGAIIEEDVEMACANKQIKSLRTYAPIEASKGRSFP